MSSVSSANVAMIEPVAAPAAKGVLYVLPGMQAEPALAAQVEAILFVADEPVAVTDLARALAAERRAVDAALDELAVACGERGVRLQRANGQVQLVTAPEMAEAVARFLGLESNARLSRAALEVLSIVAYRQPVTRPELDEVRGVCSDAALGTLVTRGLVEPLGRRETVGHPVEYGTTFRFLEYFGLTRLDDLPVLDARSTAASAAVAGTTAASAADATAADAEDDA